MPIVKTFQPELEAEHITKWIRTWFNQFDEYGTAFIGISGGKDSTICAKLLANALGPERVMGVLMPNGIQSDLNDARRVIEVTGIHGLIHNIKNPVDNIYNEMYDMRDAITGERVAWTPSKDTRINLPPRIRMSVLYALAQTFGTTAFVCNTCNLSEDYIGYSTKYGDNAGDFSPLGEYTVTEILAIGKALGLPDELVFKKPADGLCGLTDEDKIGFTYAMLDEYIRTGVCPDMNVKIKIDRMHRLSRHKYKPIPTCYRLVA